MKLGNLVNLLNPRAPKGLIPDAKAWVARRAVPWRQGRNPQPVAWMEDIHEADSTAFTIETEGQPAGEFQELRWISNPGATLYYFKHCRVLGDEGAVISPDNKVFADFTMPPTERWRDHACFLRRRIPAVQTMKGWYATIAWPEAKSFGHWMVESLPRVALLHDKVALLDGLFVPGPLKQFQVESLVELGIPESKIIPLDASSHFQPDHLFVPRFYSMYNPPQWLHRWFKTTYLGRSGQPASTNPGRKKIYISRADAPHRRLRNEDQLITALHSLGFEDVRLSELPFKQQAQLFHDADVVVGPHGAGLVHVLFCRPETQILEIYTSDWMPPAFMPLALSAGCRYNYVCARANLSGDSEARFGDSYVDIDRVLLHVRKLLNQQS